MVRNLTNFTLQVNFSMLNALKIRDDVLILSLQEDRRSVIALLPFFLFMFEPKNCNHSSHYSLHCSTIVTN